MDIKDFISRYRNHPVLFIGSGLSMRYIQTSYTWDGLLKKIASEINPNPEYFWDLKADNMHGDYVIYEKVATNLEKDFNELLKHHRNGKFAEINNIFYKNMEKGKKVSRFKIYISTLLKDIRIKDSVEAEISELKKARKNVSSIITTNYDQMVESIFSFNPLIGNNILLSNPYGSVYKIHGCVTAPETIIITEEDYKVFDKKYELIRAQLLSLFVHNPIIFLGYSIGDRNIKDLLKTIFSYVDYNSPEAKKIRDNFLLVEHDSESMNHEVVEHDIDMDNQTIRINKIKTDDFTSIYQAIASLLLPVSAMDIRKVQNVYHYICEGGDIKVSFTDDLDKLDNADKVLVVGSKKKITYVYTTASSIMANYFQIIDEENIQVLELINKQKIQSNQYFPVFAFSRIYHEICNVDTLKIRQKDKIETILHNAKPCCKGIHDTPTSLLNDDKIPNTYKVTEMVCSIMNGTMDLNSVETYLRHSTNDYKGTTNYRKILCAYDLKKYSTPFK